MIAVEGAGSQAVMEGLKILVIVRSSCEWLGAVRRNPVKACSLATVWNPVLPIGWCSDALWIAIKVTLSR